MREVWLLQVEWSGKSASKRSEKWKNKYRTVHCCTLPKISSFSILVHPGSRAFRNKATKILWVKSSFTIMDFNFISVNIYGSVKQLWSFNRGTQKLVRTKNHDRLINKLSTKKLNKNSKTDYARYYFWGNGNVYSISCAKIEFYTILILSSNSVIIAFVI